MEGLEHENKVSTFSCSTVYPVEYITLTVIHHSNLIGYNLDILNMFLLHFSVAVITRVSLQQRPTCSHAVSFCCGLQFHSLAGRRRSPPFLHSPLGLECSIRDSWAGRKDFGGGDDKRGHLPGHQVGFQCEEQTTQCKDAER